MRRNVLRCRYCYTSGYGDHEWTVSKSLTAKRSLPPNTRHTRHEMSFNQTMQTSPGALVFQRKILFNIPVISDLEAVRNKRQLQSNNNLIRSNKRRTYYNYQPGQRVMVVTEDPTKLNHGPYLINRIFTKGTIELQLNAGNSTTVY